MEPTAQSLAQRDYFTDLSVLLDPYAYFRALAAQGPLSWLDHHGGILVVTGFDECVEVLRNHRDFSSVNCVVGAAYPLPFTPEGPDISDQIETHRHQFPGHDLLVSFDDTRHAHMRALVNRLFTPTRLKANEDYMRTLARQMVEDAVAQGRCEMVNGIATPFVTMVIADLLGVPPEDRETFREVIDAAPPPGNMQAEEAPTQFSPLEFMAGYFARYLAERRAAPRQDILSELATATYPDGTLPEIEDLVKMATFMFGAGQDTSAKLLSNATRYIVDVPGLQETLRAEPKRIPALLEEVLRLEGSTKATFRLARRDTTIGGTPVKAGTRVLVALAAANRDPRRWEDPNEFRLERPRILEHLAFGRGVHTCAGAPLARAEVRVILEEFLARTRHIDLDAQRHGPPGERRFAFEPSFIIRGLKELHVTLEAA